MKSTYPYLEKLPTNYYTTTSNKQHYNIDQQNSLLTNNLLIDNFLSMKL